MRTDRDTPDEEFELTVRRSIAGYAAGEPSDRLRRRVAAVSSMAAPGRTHLRPAMRATPVIAFAAAIAVLIAIAVGLRPSIAPPVGVDASPSLAATLVPAPTLAPSALAPSPSLSAAPSLGPSPTTTASVSMSLGQQRTGDGWRLLAEPAGGLAYSIGAATSATEAEGLWAAMDLAGSPPSVDYSREILAVLGPAVSSTCPDVRLDGIGFDPERGLVFGRFSDHFVLEALRGVQSPAPCTADARPHPFVVALARDHLPPVPFTLRLIETATICPGCMDTPSATVGVSAAPTTSAPESAAPASAHPSSGRVWTMRIAPSSGRPKGGTVTLIDNAGIVGSIRPGTPFEPRDRTQVQVAPAESGGFALTWSMFYCETAVRITLDQFEDDVVATVENRGPAGGCDSIGDDQAIEIVPTRPIPIDHVRARLLGPDGIAWLVRDGPDADPAIDVIDRTRLSIAANFGAPEVAIGDDGIGVANLDGDPRVVGVGWRTPCSTQSGLEIGRNAAGRITFRVVAPLVRSCSGQDIAVRLAIRFSEPVSASDIDAKIEFPVPADANQKLAGTWRATSLPPSGGRTGHAMAWTGTEGLIWGGTESTESQSVFDPERPRYGLRYDPAKDRWRRTAVSMLSARDNPAMVWSADAGVAIVWGGWAIDRPRMDGATYDPATDRWAKIPDAPFAASSSLGLDVDGRLLAIGDLGAAIFDPMQGKWASLPRAPLRPGWRVAAVVGDRVLVLAFGDDATGVVEGAVLDVKAPSWTRVSFPFDPIVAGSGMFSAGSVALMPELGLAFDPITMEWQSVPECPGAAAGGVWTGTLLLGVTGAYDPALAECFRMPDAPRRAPPFDDTSGREFTVGVWTGGEYLTWSGGTGGDIVWVPNDGAVFRPDSTPEPSGGLAPTSSPSPSLVPDELILATAPPDTGSGDALVGGVLEARELDGHACFWVMSGYYGSGGKAVPVAILWPNGYRAYRDPVHVVSRDGRTTLRPGDDLAAGGGAPGPDYLPSAQQDPCGLGRLLGIGELVSVNGVPVARP